MYHSSGNNYAPSQQQSVYGGSSNSAAACTQQQQQVTEANVPQSSHIRVASANLSSGNQQSYMMAQGQHHHGHSHSTANNLTSNMQHQSEAVKKLTYLKRGGLNSGNAVNGSTTTTTTRKQLSQGEISAFANQTKHGSSQGLGRGSGHSKQIAGMTTSVKQHAQYQHFSQSPDSVIVNAGGARQSTGTRGHQVGSTTTQRVKMMQQPGAHGTVTQPHPGSKSPAHYQQQVLHHHQHHQPQQQHSHHQMGTGVAADGFVIQKRASPASGQPQQNQETTGHSSSNLHTQAATKRQMKSGNNQVISVASSSGALLTKAGRGSTSPMNVNAISSLAAQSNNKSMVFNGQQQVPTTTNSGISQKIKFLLRNKEGGNDGGAPSNRQVITKLSKQKSPKTIYEIDNTQATFGVDDNLKENQQNNFQLPAHLAQESPSIGEEMRAAHPSIQPNISNGNLRNHINFPSQKQHGQQAAGLHSAEHQPQETAHSMMIQTEEDSNPPNLSLQKKQFSQNLRYQMSTRTPSGQVAYISGAPSVTKLSKIVDKQNKSPVHIHYHNHIQVINSSDLKGGANVIATATPSKSPHQKTTVPVDSLQKPRIQRQPSGTNLQLRLAKGSNSGAGDTTPTGAHQVKRIAVKQTGAKSSTKLGPSTSVTPRLVSFHPQKSQPNLNKSNIKVASGAIAATSQHNVSPAGKKQHGQESADMAFADQLNQKLLDAQIGAGEAATPEDTTELNSLTDSVDGSKVTSEALKNLQPIQSVTPSKLQHAVKKQQTTSVPPLKLKEKLQARKYNYMLDNESSSNQQAIARGANGSGNLQVVAQASTSSSKPQNTGRVSHRLKQTRRNQNSSDVNVYKHTKSQKSSVGQHSSKAKQTVLSSSGASSNSLISLGLNGGGGARCENSSNKSANSILINELSKYINIKQQPALQKRFTPIGQKLRGDEGVTNTEGTQKQRLTGKTKSKTGSTPAETGGEGGAGGGDQDEVIDNLRHFLFFLERKKIVNITEVVQDKAKMNNLIQEIIKIDFKEFNKQSSQKFKKSRGTSGSESNGSHSRAQARRRQGTPVNVKTTQHESHNQDNYSSHVVQASARNHVQPGMLPQDHTSAQYQAASVHEHERKSSAEHFQGANNNSKRPDSKNSSHTNLPIHNLGFQQQQSHIAQKEAGLNHHNNGGHHQPPHTHNPNQHQLPQQNQESKRATATQMTQNSSGTSLVGGGASYPQAAVQHGFQSTNQSSVAQMQQLQHNYSSSQYNTPNNYVSDSSNGGACAPGHNTIGDQLMKLQNVASTSRNKTSHGGVSVQGSNVTNNTFKSKGHHQNNHQRMSSSNEPIATTATSHYPLSSQKSVGGGVHHQSSQNSKQPVQYANYKAVAVSQSKGQKMQRKGNSADPANDHSNKKFKISGLWDLANQRGDSESGSKQNGHPRRASEGQIIQRGRGGHQDSSGAEQDSAYKKHKRRKSRGNSADQVQREILRLSRGSSVKRTAKEIVDYLVIDSDKFRVNDNVMRERERLIRYNKLYLKKYRQLPPTQLDYYEFVEEIGKGAFGQVTLGIHKLTGRYVAIKAINKSYMQDTYSKQKVMQEVYILKKIRHSNIIRLFEVFQSPKHFLLVMEYAGGGDLLQYVKQRKQLDEDNAKRIFKMVVHGIAHCHCRSVLHRDIKLDNILMDEDGGIKICDFGVSRLITKNQSIQEQCGTPAYLAPEIIADKGYRGYYVDLWSLGVLLYAMLQGTVPFKAKSLEALLAIIMKGKVDFPVSISDSATNLIMSMLKIEPKERISIPNILKHPWLRTEDDLVDDQDDDHDFEMGISFRRQECNFNPLSMIGMSESNTARQKLNPEADDTQVDPTEESNDEILLTEQETNPMHQIGNINVLDIENLFDEGGASGAQATTPEINRLSYVNYCAVTQDFGTHHIDEEALKVLEGFGYPRKLVIEALHSGELNHATTCYNLLVTQ